MKKITRRAFLAAIAGGSLGISTLAYGRFFEAEWLEIVEKEIPILPEGSTPIRLLHLSDLHASKDVTFEYLAHAIGIGCDFQPDLTCITGDFISYKIPSLPDYRKILQQLSDLAPAFAVLGNHDGGRWATRRGGVSSIDPVKNLLKESNVQLLINEQALFSHNNCNLNIIGLGDLWAEMFFPGKVMQPEDSLTEYPTLVLSHNPDTKDLLKVYQWDLMLSGHTHGGQLRLPLVGAPFAPVWDKRYTEGLHQWQNRWLHISRGVGNMHGIRINCRPQVCLLHLIPQKAR